MNKVKILTAVIVILALAAPTVMAQENRALWNKSTYVQSAKIIYQTQYRQQKTRDIMYLSIDLLKEADQRFGPDPELSFTLGTFYAEIGILDTMLMYFQKVETMCADTTIKEKLRANCYKGKDSYISKIAGFRQKYWEDSYNDAVENIQQYDTVVARMNRTADKDSLPIYDSLRAETFKRGLAEFDMAAEMKPTDPKAYDGKGLFLEREKKYPEAIEEYKKVLQFNGENAKDISKIAYAYISIPDWKNSAVWFERLVDYEPQNISALVNLSICYNSLGDFDKSYTYTERVLAIEPNNLQALYNAGQYWFMKMQQAASDLSDVTDSTAAGDAKRKELDAQLTDYRTKSAGYFEKIIAINPEDRDALRRLGLLYLLSQQNEKAIEVFTRFIALEPNDTDVLDYLGRTYIQMGKFQEAIGPYEKLVENDPGNAEAWERLEELYRYTNQPEKAEQAKAKAAELRKL